MKRAGILLIPDIQTEDSRLGFETFEPMFRWFCLLSLITVLIVYLMVVQNAYLRTTMPTIFGLAERGYGNAIDLLGGIDWSKPDELPSQLYTALQKSLGTVIFDGSNTYSVAQSVIGVALVGFAILFFCFGFVWFITNAAQGSALRLLDEIEKNRFDPAKLNVARDVAVARLEGIKPWPLRWISFRLLLTLMGIGAFSLVAINVGLFFFGLSLFLFAFLILLRILQSVRSSMGGGNVPNAGGAA